MSAVVDSATQSIEFHFLSADTKLEVSADFGASSLVVEMIANFSTLPPFGLPPIQMLFEDLDWTDAPGIVTDFNLDSSTFPAIIGAAVFPPGSTDSIGLLIGPIAPDELVGGQYTACNF